MSSRSSKKLSHSSFVSKSSASLLYLPGDGLHQFSSGHRRPEKIGAQAIGGGKGRRSKARSRRRVDGRRVQPCGEAKATVCDRMRERGFALDEGADMLFIRFLILLCLAISLMSSSSSGSSIVMAQGPGSCFGRRRAEPRGLRVDVERLAPSCASR